MAEDDWMLGMTQKEIDDIWTLFEPVAAKKGAFTSEIKVNRSSIQRKHPGHRRNNRYIHQGCCVEAVSYTHLTLPTILLV